MRPKAVKIYDIADAEKKQKQAPKKVRIPSREIRENLGKGYHVKLAFEGSGDPYGNTISERLWVEITGKRKGRYYGILRTSPAFVKDLNYGDSVEFGPENICSITAPQKTEA